MRKSINSLHFDIVSTGNIQKLDELKPLLNFQDFQSLLHNAFIVGSEEVVKWVFDNRTCELYDFFTWSCYASFPQLLYLYNHHDLYRKVSKLLRVDDEYESIFYELSDVRYDFLCMFNVAFHNNEDAIKFYFNLDNDNDNDNYDYCFCNGVDYEQLNSAFCGALRSGNTHLIDKFKKYINSFKNKYKFTPDLWSFGNLFEEVDDPSKLYPIDDSIFEEVMEYYSLEYALYVAGKCGSWNFVNKVKKRYNILKDDDLIWKPLLEGACDSNEIDMVKQLINDGATICQDMISCLFKKGFTDIIDFIFKFHPFHKEFITHKFVYELFESSCESNQWKSVLCFLHHFRGMLEISDYQKAFKSLCGDCEPKMLENLLTLCGDVETWAEASFVNIGCEFDVDTFELLLNHNIPFHFPFRVSGMILFDLLNRGFSRDRLSKNMKSGNDAPFGQSDNFETRQKFYNKLLLMERLMDRVADYFYQRKHECNESLWKILNEYVCRDIIVYCIVPYVKLN